MVVSQGPGRGSQNPMTCMHSDRRPLWAPFLVPQNCYDTVTSEITGHRPHDKCHNNEKVGNIVSMPSDTETRWEQMLQEKWQQRTCKMPGSPSTGERGRLLPPGLYVSDTQLLTFIVVPWELSGGKLSQAAGQPPSYPGPPPLPPNITLLLSTTLLVCRPLTSRHLRACLHLSSRGTVPVPWRLGLVWNLE